MIEIIKGNLLDAKEKYICHQTNSTSKNASGLAHYLFERYPYANFYKNRPCPYVATGQDLPGHCIIKGDGIKDRLIIGAMGQYYPGAPHENSLIDSSKVREGYFNRCLVEITHMENVESIAFPLRIGCGIAKGNWDNYLRALEAFAIGIKNEQGARVVIYDPTP